jgi:anti-anti-sigma factor
MSHLQKVFAVEERKGTLIVVPQGDAVGFRAADVDHELRDLLHTLETTDVKRMVVDLGRSNYFGSSIIGALVQLSQVVRQRGGKFAICDVSEEMRRVLQIMKVDTLLPTYPTLKVALKLL